MREEFYDNYSQMLFQINLKHEMVKHLEEEVTKKEYQNPNTIKMLSNQYKQLASLSDFHRLTRPLHTTTRREGRNSEIFKALM